MNLWAESEKFELILRLSFPARIRRTSVMISITPFVFILPIFAVALPVETQANQPSRISDEPDLEARGTFRKETIKRIREPYSGPCGFREFRHTARIVGGKNAKFCEFPW